MAQMVKNLPAMQETWVRAWVGKISWRRAWQPTLVFLPGKFHGQRSLVGYIPWGLQRVGNDWATNTHTQTHTHIILATTMRRYYKGYSEVQGMTIMSIWAEVFSVAKISWFWLLYDTFFLIFQRTYIGRLKHWNIMKIVLLLRFIKKILSHL